MSDIIEEELLEYSEYQSVSSYEEQESPKRPAVKKESSSGPSGSLNDEEDSDELQINRKHIRESFYMKKR